jgi:hypothetical protein
MAGISHFLRHTSLLDPVVVRSPNKMTTSQGTGKTFEDNFFLRYADDLEETTEQHGETGHPHMEKVYKTAVPWLLEVLMKTDFSGDTLDILSTLGDTSLEAPTRVFSVAGLYDHIHQVLAPLGVHCHMLEIHEILITTFKTGDVLFLNCGCCDVSDGSAPTKKLMEIGAHIRRSVRDVGLSVYGSDWVLRWMPHLFPKTVIRSQTRGGGYTEYSGFGTLSPDTDQLDDPAIPISGVAKAFFRLPETRAWFEGGSTPMAVSPEPFVKVWTPVVCKELPDTMQEGSQAYIAVFQWGRGTVMCNVGHVFQQQLDRKSKNALEELNVLGRELLGRPFSTEEEARHAGVDPFELKAALFSLSMPFSFIVDSRRRALEGAKESTGFLQGYASATMGGASMDTLVDQSRPKPTDEEGDHSVVDGVVVVGDPEDFSSMGLPDLQDACTKVSSRQEIQDGVFQGTDLLRDLVARISVLDGAWPLQLAKYLRVAENRRSASFLVLAIASHQLACRGTTVTAELPPQDLKERLGQKPAPKGAFVNCACDVLKTPKDVAEFATYLTRLSKNPPKIANLAIQEAFRGFDAEALDKFSEMGIVQNQKIKKRKRPTTPPPEGPRVTTTPDASPTSTDMQALSGASRLSFDEGGSQDDSQDTDRDITYNSDECGPMKEEGGGTHRQEIPEPSKETPAWTLKSLISFFHVTGEGPGTTISSKVKNRKGLVRALLKKPYPTTAKEFDLEKIEGGEWDPTLVGTRMSLPKTWSIPRLLSKHGNTSRAWGEALRLGVGNHASFLKNLVAILRCGVSTEVLEEVLKQITDPHAIRSSKQAHTVYLMAADSVEALKGSLPEWEANRQSHLAKKQGQETAAGEDNNRSGSDGDGQSGSDGDKRSDGEEPDKETTKKKKRSQHGGAGKAHREFLQRKHQVCQLAASTQKRVGGGRKVRTVWVSSTTTKEQAEAQVRKKQSIIDKAAHAAKAAALKGQRSKIQTVVPEREVTMDDIDMVVRALRSAGNIAMELPKVRFSGTVDLFGDVSGSTRRSLSVARGTGGAVTAKDGILAMMASFSGCLDGTSRTTTHLFSSRVGDSKTCSRVVPNKGLGVLGTVEQWRTASLEMGQMQDFPFAFFRDAIVSHSHLDLVIMVSDQPWTLFPKEANWTLELYRQQVHPTMKFVFVDVAGSASGNQANDPDSRSPHNLFLVGNSPAVVARSLKDMLKTGATKETVKMSKLERISSVTFQDRFLPTFSEEEPAVVVAGESPRNDPETTPHDNNKPGGGDNNATAPPHTKECSVM